MLIALAGVAGIIIGIFINEAIRRINRVEEYSLKVFDRRLQTYEKLSITIDQTSSDISDIINDDSLKPADKYNMCFKLGLDVVIEMQRNQLYINNYISIHIGGAFVNTGDIVQEEDDEKRELMLDDFKYRIKKAQEMIANESGVSKVNKHFQTITKATHKSPIIDYYNELKKTM